ncbi:hypothetical protein [Streptomyces sp. NPDC059134]|uniref:hypothetical protein n=1 Tax=Streptomyces sp. NPDC059134 TaxID=3346738 RepID=UPI003694282E
MTPARITRGRRSEAAIAGWLLKAAADPEIAKADWEEGRPAMLPLGGCFDAVKMQPDLVHAATANTAPVQVCDALARLVDGPMVCHPGTWFYALVPAGTTETWKSPDATVLGRGAWLGVPRLDSTRPASLLPYWAVPPKEVRQLCTPEVADLLRAGVVPADAGAAGALGAAPGPAGPLGGLRVVRRRLALRNGPGPARHGTGGP